MNPASVSGPELGRVGKSAAGFTLGEILVVILLAALIIQGGWKIMATFRRAGERVAEVAEGLETVRTVSWILGEEISGSVLFRDWWPGEGNTLVLRVFRGSAFVVDIDPEGSLNVCFRGIRNPNPEKDSILFLGEDGFWTAHALQARVRGEPGCLGGGDGWEEAWRVEPELATGVVGRLFERGSYHFADGAFRFRQGDGGRQPLTPQRIFDGTLGVEPEGAGSLRWTLVLSGLGSERDTLPWSGWIR